jgi:predicted acetyltransferase
LYKNTITLKRNNSIATLFFNKNCNNIYHLLKTFPENEIMELDEELLKSLGNKIWEFDGVYKNWNTYNELIDKIPYTNHHTNIVFSIFNINKDFSLLEIVDFFKSLEQKGYNNENMYFIISLCNDNINKYALLYTI